MSQIIFNELSDIIQNRLHAVANYQFVMLNHVLTHGKSSKTDICKSLSRENYGADPKTYRNCPVFRVLCNKKMVLKTTENKEHYYQFAKIEQLTPNEKNDLNKIILKSKLRYENK